MKRKVTCLKERRELYNHRMTLEEYRKICRTYGEKLEKDGWILSVIEGGCISPDRSTIYIYFRDPYEGELLNFIPNTEKQYEKICKEFMDKKDFIDENHIWKEMNCKYDMEEIEKKINEKIEYNKKLIFSLDIDAVKEHIKYLKEDKFDREFYVALLLYDVCGIPIEKVTDDIVSKTHELIRNFDSIYNESLRDRVRDEIYDYDNDYIIDNDELEKE